MAQQQSPYLALFLSAIAATGCDSGGRQPGPDVCAETDCIAEVESLLRADLGVQHDSVAIIGSACREGGVFDAESMVTVYGAYCECAHDDDGSYKIGSGLGGCAVRGHAHACLFRHGEIDACDPDTSDSCADVCAELEQRIADDAASSASYRVREAWCRESSFEGSSYAQCNRAVIELDGFCYPMDGVIEWSRWQSCDLDDEEILDAGSQDLPDCDRIPNDVPATVGCFPACDSAADCADAQGCWFGPEGDGFGMNHRGQCQSCLSDADCLDGQECVDAACR